MGLTCTFGSTWKAVVGFGSATDLGDYVLIRLIPFSTTRETMVKARVATRMKAAVKGKKSHNEIQNLTQLQGKYTAFARRLSALVAALKAQHGAMLAMAKTRQEVSSRTIQYWIYENIESVRSRKKPSASNFLTLSICILVMFFHLLYTPT